MVLFKLNKKSEGDAEVISRVAFKKLTKLFLQPLAPPNVTKIRVSKEKTGFKE